MKHSWQACEKKKPRPAEKTLNLFHCYRTSATNSHNLPKHHSHCGQILLFPRFNCKKRWYCWHKCCQIKNPDLEGAYIWGWLDKQRSNEQLNRRECKNRRENEQSQVWVRRVDQELTGLFRAEKGRADEGLETEGCWSLMEGSGVTRRLVTGSVASSTKTPLSEVNQHYSK